MKKILSIICAISILMSVLIIPSAFSISAEDVATEEVTSDLGVAVKLVPSFTENIVVTETENEDGTVDVTVGESDAWGKHSMTFDYQIEAGYTYVMEFDYVGRLVSGASYTEPVSISGVSSAQGYVGGYPAEHIVVGLTNSDTTWKTGAKFAFSGDEFLKCGKSYLCMFWWCIEGARPQFRNMTITKYAQLEGEIVPEKIKEVDYTVEDGDIVYRGYPNWGSGSMTFDYQFEAGYDYYLIYEFRGHNWFNNYMPCVTAVATDETVTTGEKNANSIDLDISSSKTSFIKRYVKLDSDTLLASGGTYFMLEWVGCTPENIADFKNIRIVKTEKGSNDIVAVKHGEVVPTVMDGRMAYDIVDGYYYNPAFTTDVELEADKKYIVKFDYKMNTTKQATMYFGLSNSATTASEGNITQDWKFTVPAKTWETAFVIIDTTGKDLTTNKYLGFRAATAEIKFDLYISNLTVEEYTGTDLLPTALKFQETFLGTDGEKLYIEIDSTFNTWTGSAFATDVELEKDKKYIVSYDYKLTGKIARQWFGLTTSPTDVGNSTITKTWPLNGLQATDTWKSGAMIIDTTGIELSEKKYFAYNSSHEGNSVDLKLANLKITELDVDTIIPTAVKNGEMFMTYENGDIYWYADVPGESYKNPTFSTDFEIAAGKKYAVNFDYKLQSSFVNGMYFGVTDDTTDSHESKINKIQQITLKQAADWTNATVFFDTTSTDAITEAKKYLAFSASASWAAPKFSMKNLTITEVNVDSILPSAGDKFTYAVVDGEIIMNYSATTAAGEYDTVGFNTTYELENNKEYIVAFDYMYNGAWLNDALRAVSTGSAWDESRLRPGMVDLINTSNTNGEWSQMVSGFVAATDETNKYLGFAAMTNKSTTYELSIKGIKLYENGDVNLDNIIDTTDIVLLKKTLIGADAEGAAFTNISLDKEGTTNVLDLVKIKKILVEKEAVAE